LPLEKRDEPNSTQITFDLRGTFIHGTPLSKYLLTPNQTSILLQDLNAKGTAFIQLSEYSGYSARISINSFVETCQYL